MKIRIKTGVLNRASVYTLGIYLASKHTLNRLYLESEGMWVICGQTITLMVYTLK